VRPPDSPWACAKACTQPALTVAAGAAGVRNKRGIYKDICDILGQHESEVP